MTLSVNLASRSLALACPLVDSGFADFSMPIEVGQHHENFITILIFLRPVDHIFDFCLAIYDIPYPIEFPLCLSLLLQTRSNMLPVYTRRFLHGAEALLTGLL